jgi:hypothetical protein
MAVRSRGILQKGLVGIPPPENETQFAWSNFRRLIQPMRHSRWPAKDFQSRLLAALRKRPTNRASKKSGDWFLFSKAGTRQALLNSLETHANERQAYAAIKFGSMMEEIAELIGGAAPKPGRRGYTKSGPVTRLVFRC